MLFSLEKERKGRKKKEEKEKEMESNLVYFPKKKTKKGLSHFSQRCENSTFFIEAQLDSRLKFQS